MQLAGSAREREKGFPQDRTRGRASVRWEGEEGCPRRCEIWAVCRCLPIQVPLCFVLGSWVSEALRLHSMFREGNKCCSEGFSHSLELWNWGIRELRHSTTGHTEHQGS